MGSSNRGHQLVQLRNGAYSIRCLDAAETFHPVIGPVAEAEALYVHQLQLRDRFRAGPVEQDFVLWDVGLGAAANALTVLRSTRDIDRSVRIVSFDHSPEPLKFALQHAQALGYFDDYAPSLHRLLEAGEVKFQDGCRSIHWRFHLGDFPTLLRAAQAGPQSANDSTKRHTQRESEFGPSPDAILFDAFSPERNPTMWTLPVFQDLYRLVDPNRDCTMPTYSRSTMLRVTLLLAGFYVGVGHATGTKTETTLAANQLSLLPEPLGKPWLERVRRSHRAEPITNGVYQIAPLSEENWRRLQAHPQFENLR